MSVRFYYDYVKTYDKDVDPMKIYEELKNLPWVYQVSVKFEEDTCIGVVNPEG